METTNSTFSSRTSCLRTGSPASYKRLIPHLTLGQCIHSCSFFVYTFGPLLDLGCQPPCWRLTTSAPGLLRRADPSLPCNFSPTNGLPPICLGSFPRSLPTYSTPATAFPPAPTAAPTCFRQNEDPDAGIDQQGCILWVPQPRFCHFSLQVEIIRQAVHGITLTKAPLCKLPPISAL